MSALHRSWLADQADAIKYQREMRELDTYANPYRRAALVPRQPQPVFQPRNQEEGKRELRQRAAQDHADRKTARAAVVAMSEAEDCRERGITGGWGEE